MRVLLTHHFPLHGPETGRYVQDLAAALIAAGHEVHGLICDARSAGDEPFEVRRVICRSGAAEADLAFDVPGFAGHATSGVSFEQLSDVQIDHYRDLLRRQLDAEVELFNPDIIHSQHIWLIGQLALETGVPYVLTAWGPELHYAQDTRYRGLIEQAAENAGCILAGSSQLVQHIVTSFDGVVERTLRVPVAVDAAFWREPPADRQRELTRLGLADGSPLLICFGEGQPDDGFDLLLNAAARYEQEHPRVLTVLGGSGPASAELLAQSSRLGLRGLRWIDHVDRDGRRALYQSAELVVIPARAPVAGVSALEALAAGAPLVATSGSALSDILPGDVGELDMPADHELLAESIGRAIDGSWRSAKAAACDLACQEHDMRSSAAEIVKAYEGVLRRRFGRAP